MNLTIRPILDSDIEPLVQLTLTAFEPIFSSFKQILGPEIYAKLYPDWRVLQSKSVEKFCQEGEKTIVWVGEVDGIPAGFIVYILDADTKIGEVYFLAVHPDYQNSGIGTELNNFALKKMKESGMTLAVVGTGGDDSHAPARRSYEKAGYTALPLIRYYKDLVSMA